MIGDFVDAELVPEAKQHPGADVLHELALRRVAGTPLAKYAIIRSVPRDVRTGVMRHSTASSIAKSRSQALAPVKRTVTKR